MRIAFLVNEIAGGWGPTDIRLGGTEESVVQWSKELVKRGHGIRVYHNPRVINVTPKVYGGAVWCNRKDYGKDSEHIGFDICINVKSPEVKPLEPTLYFTNETDASARDLSKYKGVIWPSEWAEENIPVNNPIRYILPHGYDQTTIYPGEKILKQCLYASSPDRGLMTLLQAWPKVYAAHPDATLKVTYGAPEYDIPGVDFLGEVDEEQMNELYRTSDVWCHPANGGELFCITGIKAQAAGCVPVVIPTMALKETVKHGYFAENADEYADTLIFALSSNEGRKSVRERLAKRHFDTWEDSTTRLLEIIHAALS